ncbi:MAG: HEAT repeat domain-containing protein [Haloarculaceae archaeon]
MAERASGGQGVSLDEAERAFLERCATRPGEVDVENIFERLDADPESVGAEEDAADVRRLGARGLVQYSRADPDGLASDGDRIRRYLSDDDEDVRSSAIMVIQRLVDADVAAFSEPPVEALLARLGKEDQPGSKRVAQTLVELLDAEDPRLVEAVDTTVDCFGGDRHEAGSAIQALSVLGDAYPRPVIDRLTTRLGDDDSDVRTYAVRTLATLSEDNAALVGEATDRLLAVLDTEDAYTREHALEALVDVAIDDPTALEAAIPRLTALVDADHSKTRRGAVRILAELGRADVDIEPAVTELRNRLDDDDKIVRRDACYALGILRAEDAAEDIRTRRDDYDLEFAAVADATLERINTGESTPPMTDLDPGEIFVARN